MTPSAPQPPSEGDAAPRIRHQQGWLTLIVSGPDRARWLDGVVTCGVRGLAEDQAALGLALNRVGKIQSVLWVLNGRGRLWLAFSRATQPSTLQELERLLVMEDAELSAPEEPHAWFTFHGPGAEGAARQLARQHGGVSAGATDPAVGGLLGVPERAVSSVLTELSGRLMNDAEWLSWRIHHRLSEFGQDFDTTARPHEAALDRRAIDWKKGCYLGQEVVCMQDLRGKVHRSIRPVRIAAPPSAAFEAPLALRDEGGAEVGSVTSLTFDAQAGAWLGLATLQLSQQRSPLHVQAQSNVHVAQVLD